MRKLCQALFFESKDFMPTTQTQLWSLIIVRGIMFYLFLNLKNKRNTLGTHVAFHPSAMLLDGIKSPGRAGPPVPSATEAHSKTEEWAKDFENFFRLFS